MDMKEAIKKLQELQKKIGAYRHAMDMLYYDGVTVAPSDAAAGRGISLGILSEESYKLFVNEDVKELLYFMRDFLSAVKEAPNRLPNQMALEVEKLIEDYEKMSKIPMEEYVRYEMLINDAQDVWHKAKNNNDYASFSPYLTKIIAYKKTFAGYYAPDKDPYDVWLDEHEKGLTQIEADAFFNKIKTILVPLIKKIQKSNQTIDDSFLYRNYPIDKQRELSDYIMNIMGIDRTHCTIAETEHPFTLNFNLFDVRITTHYYVNNLASSLYSVIHESGHALYELHGDKALFGSCLAGGTSMGIHESQSRFYENSIGRSFEFISFIFPKLMELFPQQLKDISPLQFYLGVNKSQPSLLRTAADELTYSLHVLVRYEIEKMLFAGTLTAKELPAMWNKLYMEYLGISVPDDTRGVLQDSHWSGGDFGYFPSYSIGSAYAAQMLSSIEKELDVWSAVTSGDLSPIVHYFTERIYRFGHAIKPKAALQNCCHASFEPTFYTDYLQDKYSKIYKL